MKVTRLRTLNLYDPIGIGRIPYFSWVIESSCQNVMQTAYAMEVQDDKEQTVWKTGWVNTDENTYISYQGEKLQSCTGYRWTVQVKDNHGEIAKASGKFETAILDADEWQARWVADQLPMRKREHGFGNQPPATLFSRKFRTCQNQGIASARIYASAHGVYQLYLNGQKVDNRELAPGYASYDRIMPYQTYDISEFLASGENQLDMYVGDGWYFSPETSMHKELTQEEHHAVLFQILLRYQDGTEEIVGSDEQVMTAYGPVRSSDLFAGEFYDANLEACGGDWEKAVICDTSLQNLRAEADDVIREIKLLPAKEWIQTPKGENVIDFGQNMAGRVRMQVRLPKGYRISLRHFEVLDQDGNFFDTILSTNGVGAGADQKIEYLSSGKESEYEPLFTYFGFRYIRIQVMDDQDRELSAEEMHQLGICKEDFKAIALSTAKEELGSFECSDSELNQLYSNIRWSQYSNMISIPTDCPQREKAGWTGDAAIYIETALENEEVTPLFTRWMQSVAADQQEDGMIPMVVPFNDTYSAMATMMGQMTGMQGPASSAGWGDVAVKVPWSMYQVSGNRMILLEQYETMKKWCDYVIGQARIRVRQDLPEEKEQYLWNFGFHYGEWLIPSTSAAGFADEKAVGMAMMMTGVYTAPIYGYYSVSTFAEAAKTLGRETDYNYYHDIALKMKDAIQSCLIGPQGQAPAEYMGAYVLLLYFDLVPEAFRTQYEEHLLEMIRKNDNCLDTGFLATPYLLPLLDKIGRTDAAYKLLWQKKSPSWLYEVEHGATTIWETWNAVNEEMVPQHVSMNHYSFGCVADWMFKTIGGVQAAEPGYRHIVFEPKPDDRLQWAKRSYLSEQGLVSCSWKRTGSRMEVDVTIPCNTTATVKLPDGLSEELGSGTYHYRCEIS